MHKRTYAGVMIVVLVALLAAGGIFASNMGFKLNYRLDADPTAKDGRSLLSLPYNRQSGVDTADDLMNDMVKANVASIQRLLKSGIVETYTGRKGTPSADFGLTAGEAYVMNMNTGIDYIIVGSHDPGYCYNLDADPTAKDGKQLFATPYHTTAATADALMIDMVKANVASIQRLLKSGLVETYTGRKGTPSADFSLVPGEGYVLNMNSSICYQPSHY